jgi:hypothetical protein
MGGCGPNCQANTVSSQNGIEKGWRMYREGKPCTPIDVFPSDASGNHNTVIPMPLSYVGYPTFPVTAELLGTNCPASFNCAKQFVTFPTAIASPLAASFTCKTASTTPTTGLGVDVQLVDAYGAKTNIQQARVTCIKP